MSYNSDVIIQGGKCLGRRIMFSAIIQGGKCLGRKIMFLVIIQGGKCLGMRIMFLVIIHGGKCLRRRILFIVIIHKNSNIRIFITRQDNFYKLICKIKNEVHCKLLLWWEVSEENNCVAGSITVEKMSGMKIFVLLVITVRNL